jgi:hypothetical protein
MVAAVESQSFQVERTSATFIRVMFETINSAVSR